MNCPLRSKPVFIVLLVVIFSLLAAHAGAMFVKFYLGHPRAYGFVPLFDFSSEGNIPSFYSALALLVSGCLLGLIAMAHKTNQSPSRAWFGLAAIFVFLSVDESVSIHERLVRPFRELFDASGAFYYAWVIPYGILTIVLTLIYCRFLLRLPRRILGLFVVAGGSFVTGALGLELIGGSLADAEGTRTLVYAMVTTVEELLEMFGVAVFIYALLEYAQGTFDRIALEISSSRKSYSSSSTKNPSSPSF